jgi:PAS domain S-box-containing protein
MGSLISTANLEQRGIHLGPTAHAFADGSREAGVEEFTSAFENAPVGMALVGPDSKPVRINSAFCRMTGYSESELLTRPDRITHADDIAEDLHQRALCLAGAQDAYQREKRYLHRDGHIVWGHLTCSLVRDAGGRPLHFISQVLDITQSKRAQQAVRSSEERFRSLTMLSSDWYWEQDEHFRFISFSGSEQAQSWRADHTMAMGSCRWDFPALQPLNTTWSEHRARLERHEPFRDLQYVRAVRKEAPRYLSCSGEPVFDAAGRFTGYRGTVRDITESKMAEQRLRETQALLHMAAKIGRLGAWSFELGQERVVWSEELCAIHDLAPGHAPTPEQAIGFFAPEHQASLRKAAARCLRHGTAFDLEGEIVTGNGRRVWVRIIGEAERDDKGRVRRIQGACQDISDAKRAAGETRRMAEQLTTTLESLGEAFFTLDREGRFTYVNAKAERAFGLGRAELIGMEIRRAFPGFADSEFERQYRRVAAARGPVRFEAYYRPFGVWVRVKAYPSRQGVAVYAKDVTQRVIAQREILRLNAQLEERVRERTAQLEAANRELEAFSYSIAHDLRAPLSSIDGFSRMLEETSKGDLPERSLHYLGRIRRAVKQMGELTDGLLSLAKLSRASLRNDAVDLAVLARAAIASCREREPGRQVDVRITPYLPVRGDARLLAQVIGNLVGNAWKFSAGRECSRIEIGTLDQGAGGTAYFVRDDGAGFDMSHADKLFEAFARMHPAELFEGTGIGLAIVHKIVARHGGRVWAESEPDRGATFFFTLGTRPE